MSDPAREYFLGASVSNDRFGSFWFTTKVMKEGLRCIVVDPPGRLESRNSASNEGLEREGHADDEANVKIKKCEEELENRMEAILALRDVVMQQRKVISSLKSSRQDLGGSFIDTRRINEEPASWASTISSGSESTNPRPRPPSSFGPSHDRTDDEVMSALTCEEDESYDSSNVLKVRSHIKDVVESIREQACHVDAVIALDKLHTTKSELLTITNDLKHRSAEVGELKNQIKSLGAQLATLELERDLCQADASRSKADLKECLQYIVKLKADSGNEESHHPDSRATVSTLEVSQTSAFATPNKTSHHHRALTRKDDGARQCNPSETEAEDNQNQETPSTCVSEHAMFPDDSFTSSASMESAPRRNLALCFWVQRNRQVVDEGPAFERMDDDQPGRALLFHRRSKNRKKKNKGNLSLGSEKEDKSRSAHIVKLNKRLAEASRDAEKLRARISSMTRYYDNVVRSLQQNARTSKSGNKEFETDMINHLSMLDHEKREAMSKLRQKGVLIANLQKEMAGLLGNLRDVNEGLPVQERRDR